MIKLAGALGSYRRLRSARYFFFSLSVIAMSAGPVCAQVSSDQLQQYIVSIGLGHGVYLGNGFIITASHVVGPEPKVGLAGRTLEPKVVKRGDLNDVDLTLLSIDDDLPKGLGLRHIALCQNSPGTGEPVLVPTADAVMQTYVLSPSLLPEDVPTKFRTVIRYIAPGNSGSGVFDAKQKCLLGIISRKISAVVVNRVNGHEVRKSVDIAKYFVPAAEIAKFIPREVHY